jgi:hypothetical protein
VTDTSVLPVDLAGLDGLEGDALGLFCWSDVRPLRGVLGLVDWRLCGAVSRAVLANLFTGAAGETLLLPAARRMGPRRLFVFGLGPRLGWDAATLQRSCQHAAEVLTQAGARSFRLGAPAAMGDVRLEQAFVQAATPALAQAAAKAPLLVERV